MESVVGEGSTFAFYLPASKKSIIDEEPIFHSTHSGNGNILIMDDETYILEIVNFALTEMGYHVIESKNGSEALQILKELQKKGETIRGIFLDLTIPGGVGGKEVIGDLRKLAPEIPIFASSGYSDDPVIARPAEFGFTASIRKPLILSDLSDLLNQFVKG